MTEQKMSDEKLYLKYWPENVPKEVEILDKTLVDFFSGFC